MGKSSILEKYNEVIRYILVGGCTTLVSLAVYYLSVYTFLDPKDPILLQIANILSWILSVAFAYLANRIFVFKSKNQNKLKEIVSFILSRIFTLLFDMTFMFILVTCIKANDKFSKLLVQIIVIVLNYFISKRIVFRKEFSEDKYKRI